MRANRAEVERLLRRDGVVLRRQHPELKDVLTWHARRGRLVALLPGVYVDAGQRTDPAIRLRAGSLWVPDGVLTETAAAKLTYAPGIALSTITVAAGHERKGRPGFTVQHRYVPPELIVERGGIRCTSAALTALDLVADTGSGQPIDDVLRTGHADLADLRAALALSPYRRGNPLRLQMLLDSRDRPWSEAERVLHRLLRGAGITGWRSNLPVTTSLGDHYLDVGFRRRRLGLEVDGYEHHSDRQSFERDRARQNALVLDGWIVLRFTWRMLTQEPASVLAAVRQALDGNTRIGAQTRSI
ncbi:DUF559 domain-containing protein [Propionibacteriaceae bacterium Y1700]|uniref:DUF559 domain-containing protein n=1 Tax=Microlunatus sp. Y1700 TaxID=3418487 RepID=UPI003DA6FC63